MNVEDCLYKNQILEENSKAISRDVSTVLCCYKATKYNVSGDEYRVMRNLCQKEDITVFKVDKGNATLVLYADEHNEK